MSPIVPFLLVAELLTASPPPVAAPKYEFTTDWFTGSSKEWEILFAGYKGRPELSYLEIGVFEGQSLLWMLQTVLAHPTSKATAVDLFFEPSAGRFRKNLAASGQASRVQVLAGFSNEVLRRLPLKSFDIIYVDASHRAGDVLFDAAQSWDLLKPGGILLFDDYKLGASDTSDGGPLPDELRPMVAVDALITAHRGEVEVVYRGYQVALRKLPNPCSAITWDEAHPGDHCSPVGPYLYYWNSRKVVDPATRREAVLDAKAADRLQRLLRGTPVGELHPTPATPGASGAALKELLQRLAAKLAETPR